jgi:ankyrin repeat protein/pimeloyl-ACP methyl ester carboxylesterase
MEAGSLAISYLQTIRAISLRLQDREKGSKANAKLYNDISGVAEAIQTRIAAGGKVTDSEREERIREVASELPRIRVKISRSKSRRDISAALQDLRDAEAKLVPQTEIVRRSSSRPCRDHTLRGTAGARSLPRLDIPGYDEASFSAEVRKKRLHAVSGPRSKPDINVIFVHGLNGDAYTTWRGQTSVFWPRDLLGQDLESSRIWTYSCQTQIDMKSKEQKPLEELLEHLANDLLEAVDLSTQGPVIWVAHSLGGLLVKSALINSKSKPGTGRVPLLGRTRGVLFLGTPHSGSTLVTRSAVFTRILSTLSEPKQPSQVGPFPGEKNLESTVTLMTTRFAVLMDQERLPIVSFYETQPMLTESGPFIIVESVTNLNHPRESVESLEGNHLTMCKFETVEEKGYQTILGCIRDMRDGNFTPKRSQFFEDRMTRRTPSKRSSATDAVNTDIGMIYTRLRKKLDVPLARWKSAKTNDHRDGMWIKKSTAFQNWMTNLSNRVLLIYGPVGSGKTVVAESIMEHLRDIFALGDPDMMTCHLHLFFRSDQRSQQDPITILESLIAQVLDQNKLLVRHLPDAHHQEQMGGLGAQAALEGTLRVLLEDTCWSGIYLVVDALDECYDSLAQSTMDILALLLGLKLDPRKVRAVFTTSTEAMVLTNHPPVGRSEGRIRQTGFGNHKLTMDLDNLLNEKAINFVPLELQKDVQWRMAVGLHVDEKLRTEIQNPDGRIHADLKKALMALPQISFLIVNLAIQHFKHAQLPSTGEPPPLGWLEEELADLSESASVYDRLLSLAQTQPIHAMTTLSILACAFEPLRMDQLAMIILYDDNPEPDIPPNDDWNSALGLSTSLQNVIQSLLRVDGEGLHLSSDTLRRTIRQQMSREDDSSERLMTGDNRLSVQFEKYERMQGRIAQACLRILLHEGKVNRSDGHHKLHYFPSKAYAERNWRGHLREADLEGEALNGLVLRLVEMQQQNDNRPQPTYKNTSSRLLHCLVTDNLAVPLKTIYNGTSSDVELPSPVEFNAMLDKSLASCTPQTLESLQRVPLRVKENQDATKVRQRLEIAVDIRIGRPDQKDILAQKLRDTVDEVREKSLHFAFRTNSLASFDDIVKSIDSSLSPLGSQVLLGAVKIRNRPLVQNLLRHSKRLTKPSLNESLIEATWPPDIGICEDLMKYGADINSRDPDQSTPLHLASYRGHSKLVALTLSWNASTNLKDSKKRTPLHRAAECGHDDVVKMLLAGSASVVECDSKHRTAFFIACARGWKLTATILWQAGSNLMHEDEQGQTALHAAAKTGHQSVVEMLLCAGILVDCHDKKGITPLHEASRSGWASIVKLLLDAGADISRKDNACFTCLHHACSSRNGPEAIVKLLLHRGANPAERTLEDENVPTRPMLDTEPSNVQTVKEGHRTPLLIAAESSTVRVLKIFASHDRSLFDDRDRHGDGVWEYVNLREKSMSETNREEKQRFVDRHFPKLVKSHHSRALSTQIRLENSKDRPPKLFLV